MRVERTVRHTSLLTVILVLALMACSSQPAASEGASDAPPGDIQIAASYLRFDPVDVDVPAGEGFKIAFDNRDAATVHDIDIHRDAPSGEVVFDGPTIAGPAATSYDVPALSAGTYAFVCSVHPGEMRGTMNAH